MRINFFTSAFPYSSAETFIENELPVISQRVDAITIFPYEAKESGHRPIPANCAIVLRPENKVRMSFRDCLMMARLIITEFFLTKKKYYYVSNLRKWISVTRRSVITSKFLASVPEITNSTLCYSYWMNEWALPLAVLKIRRKIPAFAFRTLGYDIWDDRSPGNYLPFRGVIYKHAAAIYPNSKTAEEYLKKKKLYPGKIKCMYLGTEDYGFSHFDPTGVFTIVSCSSVIPLKRVNLIAEIISLLSFKVRWVHIGSGRDLESLKELSVKLNSKHDVLFNGHMAKDTFYDFFKKTSINLFITTSESEGLPVSLQEAISFGIPCMATDVGGVREVVTDETGILIPKDFDLTHAARLIEEFSVSSKNTMEFRKQVRACWQNKFTASSNYNAFMDALMAIEC